MKADILNGFTGSLKGGEGIKLRLMGPDDIQAMQRLFRTFSSETIFHRFQEPIPVMTAERARRCTGCTSEGSFAVAAYFHDSVGREVLTGIARIGVFAPGEAEFAIVVGDPWHRQGIGSLLVRAIGSVAAQNGIEWLESTFDMDNRSYLDFCEAAGLKGTLTWEHRQFRLRTQVGTIPRQI